ncbi:MAG: hypothetical protein AAF732_12930 [Pseudomonadota bacterium]
MTKSPNVSAILQSACVLALGLALTGCRSLSHLDPVSSTVPVSNAALPTAVQPYPRIEGVLHCIRESGVVRRKRFVVGSFADSTGKINAVAQGATGNFVPQGGSAAYITDALNKMGATAISTYFGRPSRMLRADYAINGIFNSLDFGAPAEADVRIAGIGPTLDKGFAQLTLSIQLDRASTRVNRQMSMIQRPVRYQQIGVGSGRVFGHTLVTGNLVARNQERLQFEALNGPIALGVADVIMKEFPRAAKKCRKKVADLLNTSS